VTGFVVPVGDIDALRAKLADLVASSELRNRMGTRGRAVVEESFDIESNAGRIVAVLHHAAEGTR
jgi:glycosyltransferase involved in cell wall biosynthesis